jgi:hypothetical protein
VLAATQIGERQPALGIARVRRNPAFEVCR